MIELTPKQQLFIDAYLQSFNATDAARKAGYAGNDKTLAQVGAENLRKPYIAEALQQRSQSIAKKAEKRIIDVYDEFLKNFEFTCKLRDAAEAWVKDPENESLFTVSPRDNEIDIVYWDFTGELPTQKTERLSTILERIADKGYKAPSPFVKTVDLRDYCLKVVDRCDVAIDKFAKLGGKYQQARANDSDVAKAIKLYQRWCDQKPNATGAEKAAWISFMVSQSPVLDEAELIKSIQVQEITQTLQ